MSSGHYVEHLERSLAESRTAQASLEEKLRLAIQELEHCKKDLFEAEDRFWGFAYKLNDPYSVQSARNRSRYMNQAGNRVARTLTAIKEKSG